MDFQQQLKRLDEFLSAAIAGGPGTTSNLQLKKAAWILGKILSKSPPLPVMEELDRTLGDRSKNLDFERYLQSSSALFLAIEVFRETLAGARHTQENPEGM